MSLPHQNGGQTAVHAFIEIVHSNSGWRCAIGNVQQSDRILTISPLSSCVMQKDHIPEDPQILPSLCKVTGISALENGLVAAEPQLSKKPRTHTCATHRRARNDLHRARPVCWGHTTGTSGPLSIRTHVVGEKRNASHDSWPLQLVQIPSDSSTVLVVGARSPGKENNAPSGSRHNFNVVAMAGLAPSWSCSRTRRTSKMYPRYLQRHTSKTMQNT